MPAVPLIPRVLNVAIPLDAFTDAVPTELPPALTVAVTAADEPDTKLPAESSTRTTGCVVNAAPDAVPCACVVSDSEAGSLERRRGITREEVELSPTTRNRNVVLSDTAIHTHGGLL